MSIGENASFSRDMRASLDNAVAECVARGIDNESVAILCRLMSLPVDELRWFLDECVVEIELMESPIKEDDDASD